MGIRLECTRNLFRGNSKDENHLVHHVALGCSYEDNSQHSYPIPFKSRSHYQLLIACQLFIPIAESV